jgi:N,N'-diacetyllegionaminate synthase
MTHTIRIANRVVGEGHPALVIAEAGVNHNGSIDLALKLVDAAVAAHADAVKFQTFRAAKLATRGAAKAQYQIEQTGSNESQFEMLRRLELSWDEFRQLDAYCRSRGIVFLSTPFDEESADFLDRLEMPAFKIPSGEITNLPFLTAVALKKKPMIVSTGMATLAEVDTAMSAIASTGNREVVLLHCVSNYPADAKDVNLRAMDTLRHAFAVPVGYSDHTEGVAVSIAAAALGAAVIEKHFTLDRTQPGPDHQASLEPQELSSLIRSIRIVEAAMGDGRKQPTQAEISTAAVARKSVATAVDLRSGTRIDASHLVRLRPGTGISPALLPLIVGRVLRVDVAAGSLLQWDMFV